MSRTQILAGSDAARIAFANTNRLLPREVHGTDKHRVFFENVLIGPVWQGVIANEAAMLLLNISNTVRGCWPIDICKRTDTGSFWMCISNRGALLTDWTELGGGGGGVATVPTAADVFFASSNPQQLTVQKVLEYLLGMTKQVGTGPGTIAAGDDSRFNFVVPTVYAGDVMVHETDAGELGNVAACIRFFLSRITALGGASLLNVGVLPGTVAAGDDPRFTAATPAARDVIMDQLSPEFSNLDTIIRFLVSRISGLGGAALLNVGNLPNTVCAGDDSRLAGAAGVGNLLYLFSNLH